MKHTLLRALSIALVFALLVTVSPILPAQAAATDFRGVWVTTVLNLDYPSKPGLSVSAMKAEADAILDNVDQLGYNAVILQVRPTADALYQSSLYPWSSYLTGSQDTAPAENFDPLTYWVTAAHARDLQLHAWINPFRITQGSTAKPQHDVNALGKLNPARKNPAWTVKHTDGKLYFNPGLPETRKLVTDGVAEIVRNYAVDGIQFDDYFYPSGEFDDAAAFTKYGSGYANKADWRRDNINSLIRDTYETIHSINPDVQFGVSPVGIWANKTTSQYGSDTKGFEAYTSQFADTRKWVKSGWLDYIAPQIYWNIGFAVADYAKLIPWWSDVVKNTPVKLYIGQAIYRAGESKTAGAPWYGSDEIARQAAFNTQHDQVSGVIHFRYSFLNTNQSLRNTVAKMFAVPVTTPTPTPTPTPSTAPTETPAPVASSLAMPVPVKGLTVGRPTSTNITVGNGSYYIMGTSDPAKPILMNGTALTTRTAQGYWGTFVSLRKGANTFTFTQEGQTPVSTVITYKTASPQGPAKMKKAEIVAGSVFPKTTTEYRAPGDVVTLTCTAPIGATVTVTLGGSTFAMTPSAKTAPNADIYSTLYTYKYTLPKPSATGKVITIGTPKYNMTYKGTKHSRDAGGALMSLTDKAPFYATVKTDSAFVYPSGSTTGGPKFELTLGQKDYVTAVASNGAWVRLRSGGWLNAADVTLKAETAPLQIQNAALNYAVGAKVDSIVLQTTTAPTTNIAFDGKQIVYTIYGMSEAPPLKLPDGSLFTSVTSTFAADTATYTLVLAPNTVLDGYYMTSTADSLSLNLKRHPKLVNGAKPMTGIHILLDPGHGATDTGCIGPLGTALTEKHMNLYTSLKIKAQLEAWGAKVSLTRSNDTLPTLNDRVVISRELRPDAVLSVHVNSVVESTDSTNIRGLETYYRNQIGRGLSDLVRNTVIADLAYGTRRSNQANLYVNRPTWAPSALVETGFICNLEDFTRLSSDAEQTKLATSIATAIRDYFK